MKLAAPFQPNRPAAHIERFQPFPMDALPEPIREFVVGGAKAIGCDPSYVVLSLLADADFRRATGGFDKAAQNAAQSARNGS